MPTVLRVSGLRVNIPTNDHGPPHVHVTGAGSEGKFWLNCPNGPTTLRESFGFKRGELNRIMAWLDKEVGLLCQRWNEIHGGK